MYCSICGDEELKDAKVYRYWSPDDGWTAGRLCSPCASWAMKARPKEEDFAYDKRGEKFSEWDDALTMIYG